MLPSPQDMHRLLQQRDEPGRFFWKLRGTSGKFRPLARDLQVARIPLARTRSMRKSLLHIMHRDIGTWWINAVMACITR